VRQWGEFRPVDCLVDKRCTMKADGRYSLPVAGKGTGFDRGYANRALVLLSLIAALVVYIDTMLTPALPTIAREYRVDIATTSLLISLYTVFGVAVMPVVGKLADIYGKRRVLLWTLAVYLVAATTTSFAPTFELVLVSRFFQGVGLGTFPLAFSLAREEFPRSLVPRAQGVISAVQVSGGAMGILVGAVVTTDYGWQANYHLALPCILVLTVLTFLLIKESPNRKPGTRLDSIGAAWLGTSLTAIVLGLSQGAAWGWTSEAVLGLILGGLFAIVPLALYERRMTEPVFDLRLLRQHNILIANLIVVLYGISLYVAFQAITYYMQLPAPVGFGLSVFQTGLVLIPIVVVLLPVAIVVGTVIPRYGETILLHRLGVCDGRVPAALHRAQSGDGHRISGRLCFWQWDVNRLDPEPFGALHRTQRNGARDFVEHVVPIHWADSRRTDRRGDPLHLRFGPGLGGLLFLAPLAPRFSDLFLPRGRVVRCAGSYRCLRPGSDRPERSGVPTRIRTSHPRRCGRQQVIEGGPHQDARHWRDLN